MISNTSRYALRALVYLASHKDEQNKIGIHTIATDLNIPTQFLGKILQNLVKQKLLESAKGPHGGFSVSKNLAHTTLFDVIKNFDGDDLFNKCLISDKDCAEVGEMHCSLHSRYEAIRLGLKKMFCEQTVYDLASEFKDADMMIGL